MSTNNARWLRQHAARELATHLGKTRAVDPVVDSSVPLEEDARGKWKRRLQQRRCLTCGARDLVNRTTSYFCIHCKADWRYCSTCETLRSVDAHGRDSRCKGCASRKALKAYYADPDRCLYRLRLQALSKRERSRAEQIFDGIRRRIALAELVKQTPGMSWTKRGVLAGADATYLAETYRKQVRGDVRDADAIDRMRRMRARAEPPPDDGPGDDCPDHGPTDSPCDKC